MLYKGLTKIIILDSRFPYKKYMSANKKVLITGNEAMAEAALQAGCRFFAGYPITPQNELIAYMAKRMPKAGGVFIQAESEIAAVNMVFGASAAGFRAITTSSSPGISLKQEGISYMAGAQLPCVIINVMRAGPGLGNITPSQGDYFQATKGGGHGDYNLIVLAPSTVAEAFELTMLAFDLADKYRNPVMILTDAFLGQMAEPIEIKRQRPKNKNFKKDWALTGAKNRKPNVISSLFIKEGVLEEHNKKLQEKYKSVRKKEIRYKSLNLKEADIVFVSYGIVSRIAQEAANILKREGMNIGLFSPVTLWPFPYKQLKQLTADKKAVFVFELSSGQMVQDVEFALDRTLPVYFYGRMGGEVFSEKDIVKFVKKKLTYAGKS